MNKLVNNQTNSIDINKRRFLTGFLSLLGGIGVLSALKPLFSALLPNIKVAHDNTSIIVDLSSMQFGDHQMVLWNSKPVFIIRRSSDMLAAILESSNDLRDPLSMTNQQPENSKNVYRSINPEYFIVIGICTHLGCTPQYKPSKSLKNWKGGFICPCHGSFFDLAGRVFKNMPAPINLEIPPYYFSEPHKVVIG